MSVKTQRSIQAVKPVLPEQIPETVFEFLQSLSGPSIFKLEGSNRKTPARCRIITTLLHANEPSGFRALHRFLKEGFKPLYDTYFIVPSVAAAKQEPPFSYRYLPDNRDLNRCFTPPYNDDNGRLAKTIIDFILKHQPEFVVDLHNTSGSGPTFSVSTRHQSKHISLSSFFSRWLIHTDIQLGAIMELPLTCPIITVEAGGAQDKVADLNAYKGLRKLLLSDSPFELQQQVEVLHNPIRLEVNTQSSLTYSDRPVFGTNVTLSQDIERFNFGVTPKNECVGWADFGGLEHFKLSGQHPDACVCDYFNTDSGEVRTTKPLKIFMATSRADIAKSDCILYFVALDPPSPQYCSESQTEDENILAPLSYS